MCLQDFNIRSPSRHKKLHPDGKRKLNDVPVTRKRAGYLISNLIIVQLSLLVSAGIFKLTHWIPWRHAAATDISATPRSYLLL